MTVKELIKQLEQFNQDLDVVISFIDPTDFRYTVSPESIGIGNPYDDNCFHGVTGAECPDELDLYEIDEEGESKYVGPESVVIDLSIV